MKFVEWIRAFLRPRISSGKKFGKNEFQRDLEPTARDQNTATDGRVCELRVSIFHR